MKPQIKWGRLLLLVTVGPIAWAFYMVVYLFVSIFQMLPF
jgi:hypothetical protein